MRRHLTGTKRFSSSTSSARRRSRGALCPVLLPSLNLRARAVQSEFFAVAIAVAAEIREEAVEFYVVRQRAEKGVR